MHRAKSRGNQVQTAKRCLLAESLRTCLIPPVTSCDDKSAVQQGSSRETPWPKILSGAGHIGTLCLAQAKMPDSQGEAGV